MRNEYLNALLKSFFVVHFDATSIALDHLSLSSTNELSNFLIAIFKSYHLLRSFSLFVLHLARVFRWSCRLEVRSGIVL